MEVDTEALDDENSKSVYTPIPFQIGNSAYQRNQLWKLPLTTHSCVNLEEIWHNMLEKQCMYQREANIMDKHPDLNGRMRTTLVGWLMEVCEAQELFRDSFYNAVDYVDRYLSQNVNIHKNKLQLIGITALLIAAKMEEYQAPSAWSLADFTDYACTEDEILDEEVQILKTLNWDLNPVTANNWLKFYMQLIFTEKRNAKGMQTGCKRDARGEFILHQFSGYEFIVPQFSEYEFSKIAELLDLVTMDIGSLQFCNNLTAAAAIHHMMSEELVLSVIGLKHEDVAKCIEWMTPFAAVLQEDDTIKTYREIQNPRIQRDEYHKIQSAVSPLKLKAVHAKQEEMCDAQR